VPAVILHCGEHCYRSKEFPQITPWFEFTGLQSTGHGPQVPIEISFVAANNPITRGMANWKTIKEELYNNSAGHLLDTATALARGQQSYRLRLGHDVKPDFVVVWTNNYRGTKVFATTLGHNNQTVADPRYLDLVTRGLLWSCGKLDDTYLKPTAAK
jgi:type 1 glutamine amidotransferase